MKAFIDFFRRNWGLKLLALVLAIVVYYSMRDEIKKTGGVLAPQFM